MKFEQGEFILAVTSKHFDDPDTMARHPFRAWGRFDCVQTEDPECARLISIPNKVFGHFLYNEAALLSWRFERITYEA